MIAGFSIFSKIKNKFNWNNYDKIEIIVTHLHNDHAGSLSQFVMYLWFIHGKQTCILSSCEHIKEYLTITGVPEEAYTLINKTDNIKFIKTEHVKHIDAYGFLLKINNKKILYTGDTSTLEPFLKYIDNCDELYVDVSKNSDQHLKFTEIQNDLQIFNKNGTKIILMHIDDKDFIVENNINNYII